MKHIMAFMVLICSQATLASVVNCKISNVETQSSLEGSWLIVDTQQVLLSMNRNNSNETLIGEDILLVMDNQALWFDRESECSYEKKTLADRSVRHRFICEADEIKYTASLWIQAAIGRGRYKSILEIPGLPAEENKMSFADCK